MYGRQNNMRWYTMSLLKFTVAWETLFSGGKSGPKWDLRVQRSLNEVPRLSIGMQLDEQMF